MKTSVVFSRVLKVAAVVIVTATITWQAQSRQQLSGERSEVIGTQQASLVPQPWAKHRQAQVKEQSRIMPNRFALSKAYYGKENILLEAAELARLRANGVERKVKTPKS